MYHHRAPVPNASRRSSWRTSGRRRSSSASPPGRPCVGLAWRKVRGAAWTLPIAVIGAGVIIQGVKLFVQRPAPALAFFTPLLHEAGYSFPSGHSLIAMVVYGLLGYFALHLFKNHAARLLVRVVTVLVVFCHRRLARLCGRPLPDRRSGGMDGGRPVADRLPGSARSPGPPLAVVGRAGADAPGGQRRRYPVRASRRPRRC